MIVSFRLNFLEKTGMPLLMRCVNLNGLLLMGAQPPLWRSLSALDIVDWFCTTLIIAQRLTPRSSEKISMFRKRELIMPLPQGFCAHHVFEMDVPIPVGTSLVPLCNRVILAFVPWHPPSSLAISIMPLPAGTSLFRSLFLFGITRE